MMKEDGMYQVSGLVIVGLSLALMLSQYGSPQVALALGFFVSFVAGRVLPKGLGKVSKILIQVAIVLLGFSMDIGAVIKISLDSALLTFFTLLTTLLVGALLGRWFKVPVAIASLISVGTAICGASAIAAVGTVLVASEAQIALSIACVFIFNAIALYLMPALGHLFGLSQEVFGTWAGIAIHDISSVVGAATVYGEESLRTATIVKLSRTLWILPLCLLYASRLGGLFRGGEAKAQVSQEAKETSKKKYTLPVFIVLYLFASIYASLGMPTFISTEYIITISKRLFSSALFLIGASTPLSIIRQAGWRSLGLAGGLWMVVLVLSFFCL